MTNATVARAARRRTPAKPRDEAGRWVDVPAYQDLVHGLTLTEHADKSVTWRVTCDGCGEYAEGPRVGILVLTCGIMFNPADPDDGRRLCVACAVDAWGADR